MDDGRQVLRTGAGTKLSREQKAGFVFVIVCGLSALVLGGQYLWTHMAAPFTVNYTGPRVQLGSEQDAAKIAEQKKVDTDGDTINDYDEMYIYKTSPYLADSDSDGLTDGAEIAASQDPNCAVGAACASGSTDTVVPATVSAGSDVEAADLANRQQALDQALRELQALSPADIRDVLVQSGAEKAKVDAMTDDQVTTMYQGLLAQLQQEGDLDQLVPPPAASQ